MPVSETSKWINKVSPASSSTLARSVIDPASVNLTALLAKLSNVCRRRVGSPYSQGGASPESVSIRKLFSRADCPMIAATLSSTADSGKSVFSSDRRSASIFERSRMSLMIDSRCRPALSILFSRSWNTWGEEPLRSRCVSPRMALSGVRISWLMLARKAPLAWFAASACCCASSICRVRCSTCCSR